MNSKNSRPMHNPNRPTCNTNLLARLLVLACVCLCSQLLSANAATVMTDKADYAPGTTAYITAGGFQAGETVSFQVLHADGTPSTGLDHEPWYVTDGSADDLDGVMDGNIKTTWHVCEDDCVGSTLELTAIGQTSGLVAKTQFKDSAFNLYESVTPTGGILRDAFARGSSVFGRISQARNDTCYRIEWVNPSGSVVATHDLPGTSGLNGNGNRDDSFFIPLSGPSGIWSAKWYAFPNGNFNCTGSPTLQSPS